MSFMTAPSFLQKIILIGILLTTVISACDLYLCARRKGKPYLSAVMQAIVFLLSAFLLVNLAVYVNEKEVEKYPWLSMQVVKLCCGGNGNDLAVRRGNRYGIPIGQTSCFENEREREF